MKKRLGMHFDQPVVCRDCLENIQEKHLSIFTCYLAEKSVRLNYFLAASVYFSELACFDHDIALKLRPYGGLTGNSSLDKYQKVSKNVRLYAISHDAAGFIYEIYNQDLVILICFGGKAAIVLAGICREYNFAYKYTFFPSIFLLWNAEQQNGCVRR